MFLFAVPAVTQAQFTFTTNNGALAIKRYTGSGGVITLPESTNGYPVTSIADGAFKSTAVASVRIGTNITRIGAGAFCYCASLTNVTIPSSVTNILDTTFLTCTSLTTATIPDSIKSIGYQAFENCYSLTSATIPDSVISIEGQAFAGSGVTDVTIGNGVTFIGIQAFSLCPNLTNVTIGKSLTYLDYYVFFRSPSLKGVYFAGDAPTLATDVFRDDINAIAYYLPGTSNWDTFATNAGIPAVLWLPQIEANGRGFGVQSNQFGFNIRWASGMVVAVEACTNLVNPLWSAVGTNLLSGSSSYFSDSQCTNSADRFYRLRWP